MANATDKSGEEPKWAEDNEQESNSFLLDVGRSSQKPLIRQNRRQSGKSRFIKHNRCWIVEICSIVLNFQRVGYPVYILFMYPDWTNRLFFSKWVGVLKIFLFFVNKFSYQYWLKYDGFIIRFMSDSHLTLLLEGYLAGYLPKAIKPVTWRIQNIHSDHFATPYYIYKDTFLFFIVKFSVRKFYLDSCTNIWCVELFKSVKFIVS